MHKKVVLITGGSRGIGAATALQAAASGWDVVIGFNANQEAADAVVAQITDMGRHAMAVQADMGNEEQIRRLFAVVDVQFGQLNAFVNNAGIVSSATTVAELTGERLERMFRINTIEALLCAREAVLRLAAAKEARSSTYPALLQDWAQLTNTSTTRHPKVRWM